MEKLWAKIQELEAAERFLNELGNALTMPPGSFSRVVCQGLANWRVGLNKETVPWIEEHSALSYGREWLSSGPETNLVIAKATAKADLGNGNEVLNAHIAAMTVDALLAMHEADPNREFVICDVGAGTGATTLAILNELMIRGQYKLAEKCTFYLLELSAERGKLISDNLDDHPLDVKYQVVKASDKDHFPLIVAGVFDIVVSNAVFHHNTFPDYLGSIYTRLKKDGLLIFGDWHMTICKHPALVAPLIRELGATDGMVTEFLGEFGVSPDLVHSMERELPEPERRANSIFRKYIRSIGEQLVAMPKAPEMFFLEALEPLDDKERKLHEAGFITDFSLLREKHRAFARMSTNIRSAYPNKARFMTCTIAAGRMTRRSKSKAGRRGAEKPLMLANSLRR